VRPDFRPARGVDRVCMSEGAFGVMCYLLGGKPFDRRPKLATIFEFFALAQAGRLPADIEPENDAPFNGQFDFLGGSLRGPAVPRASFRFDRSTFAHPLWILCSSCTKLAST